MTAKTKLDPQSLKPYDGYPLTAHPVGQWCKKIKGRLYYFGPIGDPDKALQKYLKHRDNLQAGLGWLPEGPGTGALTVIELCNQYLDTQDQKVQNRELSPITFSDYYRIANNAAEILGKTMPVAALKNDDWARLRSKLAKTRNATTLKVELQKIRSIFNYASDHELVDKPFKWKVLLPSPRIPVIRAERNKREPQMMTPAELRTILGAESITPQMRAMVLLGLNCAFGASDISSLPESAINLETGWINFPRPKTGIPRRCPLWPETVAAIRVVLVKRPTVKDNAAVGCVFVTRHGSTYIGLSPNEKYIDSVGLAFGRLLRKLGLKRHGVNFYVLRRIFETIGGKTEAQIPVDHIMGHSPDIDDMSDLYRQEIGDDRLKRVTDHVRQWLWPQGSEGAWLETDEAKKELAAASTKPVKKARKAKATTNGNGAK